MPVAALRRSGDIGRRTTACRLVLAMLFMAGPFPPAAAAEGPAGSSITNVAALHYQVDGVQQTAASNPATLMVAERLDLTLARGGTDAVALATGASAVAFVLANTGNGTEAFRLDATLDAGASRVRLIALDADGDGRFDPAIDTAVTEGRTGALPAGGSLRLLVVVDTAGVPTGGSLSLAAHALTGSGQPGATFAGQGDDGSDAVVGRTGAAAAVSVPLTAAAAAPTLAKSQSVLAPDGSARAMRGAVITYTLAAQFPGATEGAVIADPIPAGTTYLPGSLTLDGAALTDAADGDRGQVRADGVSVALGTVAAAVTHTVRFNVTIQ